MVLDIYSPHAIRLPDGRDLSYWLFGPAGGVPVVFFYGTPGTMYLNPDRLPLLDELGVRLLVMDRPGYGASSSPPSPPRPAPPPRARASPRSRRRRSAGR